MRKRLRVAAAQIAVSGDIEDNVRRIVTRIGQAAAGRAQAVVFPECALTGYPPSDWPPRPVLDADWRQVTRALAEVTRAARQHHIFVIVGSVRRRRGRVFNCAHAINPAGATVATYDKVQLVAVPGADRDHFAAGNRFPVFRIGPARCALQICLDLRYPENYRYLKSRRVQVVFQPFYAAGDNTEWKRPVLEGTLRCRSAENGMFLVAANVARANTSVFSRICDANGVSLAAAASGKEHVLFADLDLDRPHAHFYEARRPDLIRFVRAPARRKRTTGAPRRRGR